MNFELLKFCGQSIVYPLSGEVESYELLLRSNMEGSCGFPKEEYIECVTNQELHKKYIQWLEVTLKKIFERNIKVKYSLNLDHQELEYVETFDLLESLKKYSNQLTIEVTEVPAIRRKGSYFNSFNIEAFKRINNMGFDIAIDDVGQGINSIGNLLQVKNYIYRIKFSILHFKGKISDDNLKQLIIVIGNLCRDLSKEFVVEGIEQEGTAHWVEKHNSSLQQGYLYSKPEEVFLIDY